MLRASCLAFLCFGLMACATATLSPTAMIDQAKTMIESHERFARTGDLDGIMSNVAEDVVLLAPDNPLVQGKAAMRDLYANFLKAGTFDVRHDFEGAEVVADTVMVHGVARGKFISRTGEPSSFTNNFLLVLKRQPTGRLQFWRIAFGPSGHPMAGPGAAP